jgi:hypothetical protein
MSIITDILKFLGKADLDKVLEVVREIKSLISMIEALTDKFGVN